MRQNRIITIYTTTGFPLRTISVDKKIRHISFPVLNEVPQVADIDIVRNRVFIPLHTQTICIGHA
jgi:hypothetical protein